MGRQPRVGATAPVEHSKSPLQSNQPSELSKKKAEADINVPNCHNVLLRYPLYPPSVTAMKNFVAFILQTLGLRKGPKEADIVIRYKFLWGVVGEDLTALGSESRGEADHGECSVCLSRLREEEGSRRLPCRHLFHRVCVDKWLNFYQKTCPLCRIPVAEDGPSWRREELTDEMVIWFSSFHVAGF